MAGNASNKPGKRFERKVANSLHSLRGASMRVEDGGRYSRNRQLCDFLYWPDEGGTIAIECKAVKGTRLPLSRLGAGEPGSQFERLLGFIANDRKAILAVNYYGEDYRHEDRCYLVPVILLLGIEGRSLKEDEAAALGYRCPKEGDKYDMSILEGWFS